MGMGFGFLFSLLAQEREHGTVNKLAWRFFLSLSAHFQGGAGREGGIRAFSSAWGLDLGG
jgi:hypothetical protein